MQTNNKLRGALKHIADICDGADTGGLPERTAIYNIAKAALAEPVKNCEVGTAEEQAKRCFAYCKQYICKDCPCNTVGRCSLVWAQMPYEEGGSK